MTAKADRGGGRFRPPARSTATRIRPHLPRRRRRERIMDALTDSPASSHHAHPRSPIAHDEIRTILSNLSHELCRPLISLRAGFDLLLGDSGRTAAQVENGHIQTMVVLCDDLLRLTRSYLDYAGLVQGVRPLCYGSF